MLQLSVVVVSFTVLAVSGAQITNLSPRKADCGGINIAVRSEPFPSTANSSAPLLKCADIPRTTYPELTEFTCFMPAPDAASSEAEAVPVAAPPHGMPASAPALSNRSTIVSRQACAGEFWCTSAFTPPANVNDANALCPLIPSNVVVAPYTPGYGCICSAYALGTAVYQICNCNSCSNLAFTDLNTDCAGLVVSCGTTGLGSYHSFPDLYAYMMLFNNGESPTTVVPLRSC